ncbi:nmrA-like family domain-containing protein 1 [Gopherus evgoodei]|uniref:nmrA-like family domain-containing protein 1 n=1 Tax=Gopherus evgoodei TaxID=1825980 RepID=UPI0011CF34D5|nr:nmrA-like family domain-containing protein 1 [Gopherus evgoodei]
MRIDTPISRALRTPAVALQTTRLTQTRWCGQESLNGSGLLYNLRPIQLYQWERLPWTGWLLFTWGLQWITAEEYAGKDIGLSTCKLTVGEDAATLSKHIGKTRKTAKVGNSLRYFGLLSVKETEVWDVVGQLLPLFFLQASAQYENLSSPGIQELSNMARFYVMHPAHDMKWTLKLNPKARTFDQQLADNKAAFKDL